MFWRFFPPAAFCLWAAWAILTVDHVGAQSVDTQIIVKRRLVLTEDELRKQLAAVPQVGLDQLAAKILYAEIKTALEGNTRNSQTGERVTFSPDLGVRLLLNIT